MIRRMIHGTALSLVAVLMLNCSAMAGKSMELTSANTYYSQGDLKQAQEWYEKAIEKGTHEAQVHARLVQMYADQQRWADMNRVFQGFAECKDKPKDVEKYRKEAELVIERLWKGLWNGHVELVKEAEAAVQAGDTAGAKDKFNESRKRVDSALEILPGRLDFIKRKGDLYIQEFNLIDPSDHGFPMLQKAAEVYKGLVATAPDSLDYTLTLAQLQYNIKDFEGCRKTVDEGLAKHATNGELLNYAGKVRIQQGLLLNNEQGKKLMAEAIGFLNKAIELNPNDPMLVYNLALLYRDMGKPEEALSTFSRVEGLAAGKDDLLFDSWYSMAVLYFQDLPEEKQDAAKAAACFQKCLDLQPDNKQLKFNLGVALVRTGTKENVVRGKKLMEEGQ